MKYFALFFAGAALFCACSNPKQPVTSQNDSTANANSAAAKSHFFPVAEFLEGEILHTDSTLMALKKFTTVNGHTDSAFIQVPEFNQLALEFVPRELADSTFENNFTESAFQDQSTESITLSYSTESPKTQLQRVDVVTVRGVRNQRVKSVYLEKIHKAGDSVILKKLYWYTGKSCDIATITMVNGKQAGDQHIRVVWDYTPEE
jgi:hypothetical protein